jgi:hypothetical protein
MRYPKQKRQDSSQQYHACSVDFRHIVEVVRITPSDFKAVIFACSVRERCRLNATRRQELAPAQIATRDVSLDILGALVNIDRVDATYDRIHSGVNQRRRGPVHHIRAGISAWDRALRKCRHGCGPGEVQRPWTR